MHYSRTPEKNALCMQILGLIIMYKTGIFKKKIVFLCEYIDLTVKVPNPHVVIYTCV